MVMTTLGFGEITFASDIGRGFSLVVLHSGVVFLLVMLPFLFRLAAEGIPSFTIEPGPVKAARLVFANGTDTANTNVTLTVRDTHQRERTGLTVAGLWERGRLHPAYPDTLIDPGSVLVLTDSAGRIAVLTELLPLPYTARDSSCS